MRALLQALPVRLSRDEPGRDLLYATIFVIVACQLLLMLPVAWAESAVPRLF